MTKISNVNELKAAIEELELETKVKQAELAGRFQLLYESFRPVNLIKNTLQDIKNTPGLKGNIIGSSIGLGVGYLTNRMLNGTSSNLIRKAAGAALQVGVANLLQKRITKWKTGIQNLFRSRKEKKPQPRLD